MKWPAGILGALALAGCGAEPGEDATGGTPAALSAALEIPCAPPGEARFRRACAVDRVADATGTILTLHLPDGGFHRLRVDAHGAGIVAADGAEAARVAPVGVDQIEVAIGGARYRLPASAKRDDPH